MAVSVALWKMGGPMDRPLRSAVVTLKYDNASMDDQLLAIAFLKELGPKARPATAALLLATRSSDPRVRRAALEAMPQIDPDAASHVEP
jgi:hypothetical protein